MQIENGILYDVCENDIQDGEFIFPEGIKKIGTRAFANLDCLRSIQLPNSILEIGEAAFQACSSLKNLEIPESVIRVGDRAFDYCSSLTEVKLPQKEVIEERDPFYKCEALRTVYKGNEKRNVVTIDGHCTEVLAEKRIYDITILTCRDLDDYFSYISLYKEEFSFFRQDIWRTVLDVFSIPIY